MSILTGWSYSVFMSGLMPPHRYSTHWVLLLGWMDGVHFISTSAPHSHILNKQDIQLSISGVDHIVQLQQAQSQLPARRSTYCGNQLWHLRLCWFCHIFYPRLHGHRAEGACWGGERNFKVKLYFCIQGGGGGYRSCLCCLSNCCHKVGNFCQWQLANLYFWHRLSKAFTQSNASILDYLQRHYGAFSSSPCY